MELGRLPCYLLFRDLVALLGRGLKVPLLVVVHGGDLHAPGQVVPPGHLHKSNLKEGWINLSGKIVKVSGPLVVATGLKDANMADVGVSSSL